MDSSQDPCFQPPPLSGHIHDQTTPLDTPASATTAASASYTQPFAPDIQTTDPTQRQSIASTSSSSLDAQMALLLPPAQSHSATQLPFAMTTQANALHFAVMAAQSSGILGQDPLDASLTSSNLNTSMDESSLSRANSFSLPFGDVTSSLINDNWNAALDSTAPGSATSLGLFIPTHDQNATTMATSSSFVGPETSIQPGKGGMTVPRSLSSSFLTLNRQLPHLAQAYPSNSSSDWRAPFSAAPDCPATFAKGTTVTHQQMLAYKQSLTKAHTDRLGGLLGLPHPLTSAGQSTSSSTLDADLHSGNRIDTPPAASIPPQPKPRPTLPRGIDDLIVIVDAEDTVVWTSDSMRACAGLLSNSAAGSAAGDDIGAGWHAKTLGGQQRMKVSDLLADEQAVEWWRQACRELGSVRSQGGQISRQQTAETARKELVLAGRTSQNETTLIELAIVATCNPHAANYGHLMVQLRPVSIPAVAAVSSQPALGTSLLHSSFPSGEANVELRLLVSRNGLILRTSSSASNAADSPHLTAEARAITALFGESSSVPAFGQSLVDVPKLAPLLHVVAQAAVVGLAQTVQLSVGGRRISATVQPVLRTNRPSRRTQAAAAKVWITLSAPQGVGAMRRSSSIVPFGRSAGFAGMVGLPHLLTTQSRSAVIDRRHSYQAFGGFQHSPSWLNSHADAPLSAHTSQNAPGKSRDSTSAPALQENVPVHDSLTALMAQLEEENRSLRRQIDARRRRRQAQASAPTPFAHPFAQPQWSSAPQAQPLYGTSPLSGGSAVPGSCPTRFRYLP